MRVAAFALLLVVLAPAVSGARLVRTIHDADLENAKPLGDWSGKPLSLADVDGDGLLDVLAQNANERVYAIDPRAKRLLVEVHPRYPYGPDLGPFNGAAAADLDGDGVVELVTVNRAAVVSVWRVERDGDALQTTLAWDKHLKAHHGAPTADAGPVLADVDGDGALDVLVQTEETGVYALRADGSTLWSHANYGGNAEPVVRDVDGDGDLDVVFFTDAGIAYALDGPTGETLWRFDAKKHGVWPASITAPGVVADLDGDGRVEVAFCARNVEGGSPSHAPKPLSQHHFGLFAIRDGELLWMKKPSWGNPLCAAYLMAFDADADGKLELYGMDWNTIGHKPGGWERFAYAHAFSFDHKGNERWHRALDPWNAKPTLAAGDWDGDGDADVVAYGGASLVILDAKTGAVVESVGLGRELTQGAVLADLDANGDLDAVVAVGSTLRVLDTGAPTRVAWAGWSDVAPGTNAPRIAAPPTPTPAPSPTPTPTSPLRSTPSLSPGPTPPTPVSPIPIEAEAAIPSTAPLLVVLVAVAARLVRRPS